MKYSLDLSNIANEAEELCRMHFRLLATQRALESGHLDDVWFTGSNIWLLLYPELPRRPDIKRDWDIFAIGDAAAAFVARVLNLAWFPACRTRDKRHGAERSISASNVPRLVARPDPSSGDYGEGYSYLTDSGEIDLWVSTPGDVFDELRTYPTASHSHCRAAFSFTNGLIVLPNERARAPQHAGSHDPGEDIPL